MTKNIAIIGGGPSGLMAAEILSANGCAVTIYERKPSMARKFLMAGRGGLNITHSENLDQFIQKYGTQAIRFKQIIDQFTPKDMRGWCRGLGEETFIGSSGRVFPESFKASPLLRAWLKRLESQGVQFKIKHDWQGWDGEYLIFETTDGQVKSQTDATLLALGGASWPGLGSNAAWVPLLEERGVTIHPFKPSNCGFTVNWSDIFKQKFAGQALKSVGLIFKERAIRGEFIVSEKGVEGGAIYTLSAALRDEIEEAGTTSLVLDLKPDWDDAEIIKRLQKSKGRLSLSNYLRKNLKLSDVTIGLLMERDDRQNLGFYPPEKLANIIKNYTLELQAPFSIDRAISSAGGVAFHSVEESFMLKEIPNTYVMGEMLDWEAPTGGYLLQACIAGGHYVAHKMLKNL